MERDRLLCSPGPSARVCGNDESGVRGDSDWILGSTKRVLLSNEQISSGGRGCPKPGSDWGINTYFWSTLKCSGSWTDDLCWSLPFGMFLLYSIWFDSQTCICHVVYDWQGTPGDQPCSAELQGSNPIGDILSSPENSNFRAWRKKNKRENQFMNSLRKCIFNLSKCCLLCWKWINKFCGLPKHSSVFCDTYCLVFQSSS